MMVIIGLAGMVIDIGNVERVRESMQNAADAAATGGASTLLDSLPSSSSTAFATAVRYGMGPDGLNRVDGVDTDTVQQSIDVHCDTQYSACSTSTGPNTVTVHETASVPTFFMGMFGIDNIGVSVDSEACAPCSESKHDIMLVLDRTGSMNGDARAANHLPKIQNLKTALLNGLLTTLDPDEDRVGMVVFPPNTATASTCDPGPDGEWYHDPTLTYLAEPMDGGFVDRTGTPNEQSPLVRSIECLAPFGTTDYADPLAAAQRELDAYARPGVQKVIVMISDGGANQLDRTWKCDTPFKGIPNCNLPCQLGITAAATARNDGIDVYAIAYGDLADDEWCQGSADYQYQDTSHTMTGYDAMQQIASPDDYYADPDPSDLKYLLRQVSGAITGGTGSRLTK